MKIELKLKKNLSGKELPGTIIKFEGGSIGVIFYNLNLPNCSVGLLKTEDGMDWFSVSEKGSIFDERYQRGEYVVLALPSEWKIVRDK